MSTVTPTPGDPSTYARIPNDRIRQTIGYPEPTTVLVPISDPIRSRTLHAKVDARVFDRLPDNIRNASWFVVRDGTAMPGDDSRFTVRAGRGGRQVAVARVLMNAKPGEFVRNLSGDRLDLRLSNLRLRTGPVGRRSRDTLAVVAGEVSSVTGKPA